MDRRERQVIDELVGKLRQIERAGAAARRRGRGAHPPAGEWPACGQPATWRRRSLVQEQALANMQTRVQELEASSPSGRRAAASCRGLFGGDPQQTAPAPQQPMASGPSWHDAARIACRLWLTLGSAARSWLSCRCMQTALGVAVRYPRGRRALERLSQWRASRDRLGRGGQLHGRGGGSPCQDAAAEPPPRNTTWAASRTASSEI